MLKFVVVGDHGRDFRRRMAMCAILASLWVAPLVPQAPLEFQDLLPELAAKIAAVVVPDSPVRLEPPAPDSTARATPGLDEAIAALLRSHGVRVIDSSDRMTSVGLSCSENLRERSCVAEVQNGTRREIVMVTRPHDGTPPVEHRPPVSLQLRSLFAQRTPILDVVSLGERLLVLDATSIALYRQTGQGWQRTSSRPLPLSRVWPRDLRGRLHVEGDELDVFLPGVACAGLLSQLALECADGRRAWPLGIENSGLEPARNYFSTPEGLTFYSAAPLGAGADARWVVAEDDGTLSLLDGLRRPLARVATAGDVAGIAAACAPESYVVASELSGAREAVRLFQVARQRLVPIASPVFVTGRLTALWAAPGATTATAIAHDMSGGRYEAFLATLACSR